MTRLSKGRLVALLAFATLFIVLLSRCGKVIYGVKAFNFGQNGVLILEMSSKTPREVSAERMQRANMDGLKGLMLIAHLYPKIPSKYRDNGVLFGRFEGHDHSLPSEIEVVWQLADLRNCKEEKRAQSSQVIRELQTRGYNPNYHISKRGCTWIPLPDRIYRKKIDMKAIRESEAYKKATRRNLLILGHSHSLRLFFVFQEDQLTVEVFAYGINPWH